MIPPLLERLSNSKQMLVVAVYLSMFLDNILLTVVVPIIPDYLYTSEQKEYSPATQNAVSLLSLEPALTNSSTFLQCLENPVPTKKSPRVQPASKISRHKGEKTATAGNKKVMSNIESEYHAHQIQSDIHSQILNKQDGHVNVQQINQQNTKDRDHPYGNQYTETIKQRPVYKRGDKDKYRNMAQYSNSIKHAMSIPSEEFNTIPEFQNSNVFYDNSSTKNYNILSTEDRNALRHEDEQKQQTKDKLKKELEYMQNHTARILTQDHQKYMKNLMISDYLHAQENQHNTTTEGLNNAEQHSALQNGSEAVELKSAPSSKQASTLNTSNFSSSRRQQNAASSGAGVISASHGVIEENGRVGLLLSSKALIQLLMNPVVGALTAHVGYQLPLFVGSINLLVAALLFAFGEHFLALLLARSLQGIASACISVSGMCLVAEQFPDDVIRSRIMGIVLGSMALGVLVGYPFGSLMYDFVGKMAPFFIISVAVFLNGVLQLFLLDLKPVPNRLLLSTSWHKLLSDGHVVLIAGAIWLSTSTMAILEPCMPIWLMDNIKPQKWQLGMVFIPDSVGYLLGTNFFGPIAYNLGRWRVAVSAMMVIGLSTVLVPSAGSVGQLAVPHFGLGLGIGVVDAALVPLLASLMDSRYAAHYGSVYALQQMAVSLAYSLGPLVGGEIVHAIGFPWLMRSVGLLNLLYCPLLIFTSHDVGIPVTTLNSSLMADAPAVNYKTNTANDQAANNNKNLYRRFLNSEDSD